MMCLGIFNVKNTKLEVKYSKYNSFLKKINLNNILIIIIILVLCLSSKVTCGKNQYMQKFINNELEDDDLEDDLFNDKPIEINGNKSNNDEKDLSNKKKEVTVSREITSNNNIKDAKSKSIKESSKESKVEDIEVNEDDKVKQDFKDNNMKKTKSKSIDSNTYGNSETNKKSTVDNKEISETKESNSNNSNDKVKNNSSDVARNKEITKENTNYQKINKNSDILGNKEDINKNIKGNSNKDFNLFDDNDIVNDLSELSDNLQKSIKRETTVKQTNTKEVLAKTNTNKNHEEIKSKRNYKKNNDNVLKGKEPIDNGNDNDTSNNINIKKSDDIYNNSDKNNNVMESISNINYSVIKENITNGMIITDRLKNKVKPDINLQKKQATQNLKTKESIINNIVNDEHKQRLSSKEKEELNSVLNSENKQQHVKHSKHNHNSDSNNSNKSKNSNIIGDNNNSNMTHENKQNHINNNFSEESGDDTTSHNSDKDNDIDSNHNLFPVEYYNSNSNSNTNTNTSNTNNSSYHNKKQNDYFYFPKQHSNNDNSINPVLNSIHTYKDNNSFENNENNNTYHKPNFLQPVFTNHSTTTIPLIKQNTEVTYDLLRDKIKPISFQNHLNKDYINIHPYPLPMTDSRNINNEETINSFASNPVNSFNLNSLNSINSVKVNNDIKIERNNENMGFRDHTINSNSEINGFNGMHYNKDDFGLNKNAHLDIDYFNNQLNSSNTSNTSNSINIPSNGDINNDIDKDIYLTNKLKLLLKNSDKSNLNDNNNSSSDIENKINSYFNSNYNTNYPVITKKYNNRELINRSFKNYNNSFDSLRKRIKHAGKLNKTQIMQCKCYYK